MSLKVVDFEPKPTPHLSGQAVCLRCRHEWVTVAEVGTINLDCPSCETYWGIFNAPAMPQQGDLVWQCNCGGRVFSLLTTGPRCITCGTDVKGYV